MDDISDHMDSKAYHSLLFRVVEKNGLKTHLKGAWNDKGLSILKVKKSGKARN